MKNKHVTEKIRLPVNSRTKPEMYGFLDEAGSQIHDALIDALDQRYRIEKEAEVDDDDGEYNCTIEVRRGMRVGTDVDIEWKVSNRHATIGVDTCTKLDMIILVTTVFLGIASAFMAKLMEIPLFDLFPDIKIGIRWIPPVEVGLLLPVIAGIIIGLVVFVALRPIVLARFRRENGDLTEKVRRVVFRLNDMAEPQR